VIHMRPALKTLPVPPMPKTDGVALRCEVEGCNAWTYGGKPNCVAHLMRSAYARMIAAKAQAWDAKAITPEHPKTLAVLNVLEVRPPDFGDGWHRGLRITEEAGLDTRSAKRVFDFLVNSGRAELGWVTIDKHKIVCYRLPRSA